RPDQLLARRRAAAHRQVPGVPTRGIARRVGRVTGGPSPHRLRRRAVVHGATRDASLDERDPLLWCPLDVERHGDGPRVHSVIEEGEALAGNSFTDVAGHERAAFPDGLAAQTGERHDAVDLGDRELFEHRLVIAGWVLHSLAI